MQKPRRCLNQRRTEPSVPIPIQLDQISYRRLCFHQLIPDVLRELFQICH